MRFTLLVLSSLFEQRPVLVSRGGGVTPLGIWTACAVWRRAGVAQTIKKQMVNTARRKSDHTEEGVMMFFFLGWGGVKWRRGRGAQLPISDRVCETQTKCLCHYVWSPL